MVQLVPMTEAEFQIYLQRAIIEYADEKVKAGNWQASEAMQRSEQELKQLLPDGVKTQDQHLYSIMDETLARPVGMVWVAAQGQGARPYAFIYDLRVDDPFRRKGYGTQAMRALEGKVKELGLNKISLHVFAHNSAAIRLYEKMGYEVTNLFMAKEL